MKRRTTPTSRHRERPRLGAPLDLEALLVADDPQLAILSWPAAGRDRPPEPLTPAEAEVLELLRAGLSNCDIAARRGRSPRTVVNQVRSIFAKLGVRGRAELFARLAAPPRSR